MKVPSDYKAGHERARNVDQDLADAYVAHTLIGDPIADAAMEALAGFSSKRQHDIIRAGIDDDKDELRNAPEAFREFMDNVNNPPPHIAFSPERARPGSLVFYRNSDMFLLGLALESLTGLSEGLAKPFYTTGRALENLRRFKQNTRHIIEITIPGGMDRQGDGWKFSVRIRLIHARVRRLLLNSDEWDVEKEGIPLSMAHMAMSSTGFSALNLGSVRKLGVQMTEEESEGFMHIWHHVAWLFGVPDRMLKYMESESSAMYLRKIALLSEVAPGHMATAVAQGYIAAIPDILQVTEPAKREKMKGQLFRVARALVGDENADRLKFPKQHVFGALALVRAHRKFRKFSSRFAPGEKSFAFSNFASLLAQSVYDDTGISYRMPDAIKEAESTAW